MTNFLQYWKTKPTSFEMEKGEKFIHCGSNQYKPTKIKNGDVIWITTADTNEKLFLVGRIEVGEIISYQDALKRFNDEVFERDFHIVAKNGTEELHKYVDVTDILPLLKFESKNGDKGLTIADGKFDGREIQTLRKLTPESLALFNSKWYDTESNDLAEIEQQISSGAGFGNPEKNRKVEKAAVDFVTEHYKNDGWNVKSVESLKCGYDLLCTKNTDELHIEVKGISGAELSFIITANEVRQARNDPKFVICAVTSALADKPHMSSFTGSEFIKHFRLDEIAFRATLPK